MNNKREDSSNPRPVKPESIDQEFEICGTDYFHFLNWCCVQIVFQGKFSEPPYTLVTAEDMCTGLKHDAATVWVENALTKSFRICLRELQDFDGLHENIRVVNNFTSQNNAGVTGIFVVEVSLMTGSKAGGSCGDELSDYLKV